MEGCDCGNMGGAGFPMNNGFNTNGIGDPVCPGNNSYGSGDLFYGDEITIVNEFTKTNVGGLL